MWRAAKKEKETVLRGKFIVLNALERRKDLKYYMQKYLIKY